MTYSEEELQAVAAQVSHDPEVHARYEQFFDAVMEEVATTGTFHHVFPDGTEIDIDCHRHRGPGFRL